jgi:hypothetical protein
MYEEIMMATAKKKPIVHQSFKKSPNQSPFLTLKFTQQSVYWLILGGLVLALGIWVLSINIRLQNLYDTIDKNRISSEVQHPVQR